MSGGPVLSLKMITKPFLFKEVLCLEIQFTSIWLQILKTPGNCNEWLCFMVQKFTVAINVDVWN